MLSEGVPDGRVPVKARQDAQGWAQHMTEYMAQSAGVTLDAGSAEPFFNDCVGKVDTVLDASRTSSRHLITVETTTGGLLLFRVKTPCLMPPATPGASS
ncbi:hypothetical protein ADK60_20315 [Streptomyces sp. XY431]|uniref:hypothetical protein n=1 Tax=Streptomyces sp. XY431 TaxID=1415562 RepID=UPI0006AE2861|nr:hypothetical protein [Streptomyces sp. XY431]KOV26982.1 hypothetical protein ADK60_20315 [Streptomyces sp. XY431]